MKTSFFVKSLILAIVASSAISACVPVAAPSGVVQSTTEKAAN
jgi:hypothetical protein